VERTVNWQNIEIKLDENNKLVVTDFHNEASEDIDFREKLIDMTVGYNFLIVVTNNQCHIYNISSIQTPYKFDLKEKVKLILTCPKYFALIDDNNGINVNKLFIIFSRFTLMKARLSPVPKLRVYVFPLSPKNLYVCQMIYSPY
jgi:hypothetical protein